MPYYLFSLRITAHDEWGQQIENKLHQGIRQLNNQNIDNIWRQYKRKAEQHYRSNLRSFSVVMISKLDPRAIKFVESQAKKKEDKWSDIFKNQPAESGKPVERKKKGLVGEWIKPGNEKKN